MVCVIAGLVNASIIQTSCGAHSAVCLQAALEYFVHKTMHCIPEQLSEPLPLETEEVCLLQDMPERISLSMTDTRLFTSLSRLGAAAKAGIV